MVGRRGFEPLKHVVQQIYSLSPLATWVPARFIYSLSVFTTLNQNVLALLYLLVTLVGIVLNQSLLAYLSLLAELVGIALDQNMLWAKLAKGIEPPTRGLQNRCSTY